MLKVIVGSEDKSLGQLLIAERAAIKENQGTADAKEGMMAFMQKRAPVFNQS
jgi:enoyl-CoA hydratase